MTICPPGFSKSGNRSRHRRGSGRRSIEVDEQRQRRTSPRSAPQAAQASPTSKCGRELRSMSAGTRASQGRRDKHCLPLSVDRRSRPSARAAHLGRCPQRSVAEKSMPDDFAAKPRQLEAGTANGAPQIERARVSWARLAGARHSPSTARTAKSNPSFGPKEKRHHLLRQYRSGNSRYSPSNRSDS